MGRPPPGRNLAEQAAHAELAVLADGPWAPRWYWRSDLEEMQQASRRVGHPDGHPAAELRAYKPTDQYRPHPLDPAVSGRVWRYRPTTDGGTS